jgi:hypothetical protein
MSSHFYDPSTGQLVDASTPGAFPSPSTILGLVKGDVSGGLAARIGEAEAEAFMENARNRGTRVHKACELYATGQSPKDAAINAELETQDLDYFKGFINWWEQYNPSLLYSELFVVSHKYKYAGTLDLAVMLDNTVWIIDIKTGMDRPEHGLQLKFYQQGYLELTRKSARMGILSLDAKRAIGFRNVRSPYGLKEYHEPLVAILAHLAVFKWWNIRRKLTVKQEVVWNG